MTAPATLDALIDDDDTRGAARAMQEALKKLARPVSRPTSPRYDLGDGDVCPLDRTHGRMYHLKGTSSQRCQSQVHDGKPKTAPEGRVWPTRSIWPLGDLALAESVRRYLEAHQPAEAAS